jgi:hypothetical protein
MEKYLYGASIQGIQDYIFRTGKLSDVSGASELIELFCQELFKEVPGLNKDAYKLIQSAAGNIRCVFEKKHESDLRLLYRHLPQLLWQQAPGLSMSQAVVAYNDKAELPFDELEKKLKTQRNKVAFTQTLAWMGLERAPKTGGVAVPFKYSDESIDAETKCKYENRFSDKLIEKITGNIASKFDREYWPMDIKEITRSRKGSNLESNSWIAVIHADGNGLGKIIQNYGAELRKDEMRFKQFSDIIDEATRLAAQCAFRDIVEPVWDTINKEFPSTYKIPFRPILLGGDDLTIIIRADLAFDFTRKFMHYFEEKSKKLSDLKIPGINGLTICAGIAFIKDSYPLHYAMHLAEALCQDAKKAVREKGTESALAFYKVQESFINSLAELKERTLKTKFIDYYAGPYLLEQLADDKDFVKKLKYLKSISDQKEFSKGVGKLRQIVSESYKDINNTKLMLERLKTMDKDFYQELKLNEEMHGEKSQLLDLITLNSFLHGSK